MRKNYIETASLLCIKLSGSIVNVFLVPLYMRILDEDKFGVWLAIQSTLNFIFILDFGFGKGLRNALSLAFKTDLKYFNKLASTLLIFSAISGLLILSLYCLYINMIDSTENRELWLISLIFTVVLLSLKSTHAIIASIDMPVLASSLPIIGLLGQYTALFILEDYLYGDLFKVIVVVYSMMCLPYLLGAGALSINKGIRYFRRPSLDIFVSYLPQSRDYLVIQIASYVLYSLPAFILLKTSSEREVTIYNLNSRMILMFLGLFIAVISPVWTRVALGNNTENSEMKFYKYILRLFVLFALIFMALSKSIFALWLGSLEYYNVKVTIIFVLSVIFMSWMSLISYRMNGLGMVKSQRKVAIFQLFILPPCYYFMANSLGAVGVAIIFGVNAVLVTLVLNKMLQIHVNNSSI